MPSPDQSSSLDEMNVPPHPKFDCLASGTASRKIRTFLDSLAAKVVWVGGIATIISIMGIFVYLLIEVAPLFLAPAESQRGSFSLPGGLPTKPQPLDVGLDEYQEVAYVLHQGKVDFFSLASGDSIQIPGSHSPYPDYMTAVARSKGRGHQFVFGTSDGSAIPVEIELKPTFEDDQRTIIPSLHIGDSFEVDPTQSGVLHLAYQVTESGLVTASINHAGRTLGDEIGRR